VNQRLCIIYILLYQSLLFISNLVACSQHMMSCDKSLLDYSLSKI